MRLYVPFEDPGSVKNNLCRALMKHDTRPLVMTCADCGNREPNRNDNHDGPSCGSGVTCEGPQELQFVSTSHEY